MDTNKSNKYFTVEVNIQSKNIPAVREGKKKKFRIHYKYAYASIFPVEMIVRVDARIIVYVHHQKYEYILFRVDKYSSFLRIQLYY